jgi:hypothetical protein
MRQLLAVIAALCIFAVAESNACVTTKVSLAGNLDARAPQSEWIDLPPRSQATYTDLAATARFSASFTVYDSLGAVHGITGYFFRIPTNVWIARFVVDGGDILPEQGGAAGTPFTLGNEDVLLIMDANETRAPTTIGDPDTTLSPRWANGADPVVINIFMPRVTHRAVSSSINMINQDGSNGECLQQAMLHFDGDNLDDFAVWRPRTGMWAVLLSHTAYATYIWQQWGLPGDYPMAGDYTGDGRADLVVWRPTNGNWYICRSEDSYDCSRGTVSQFGLPGDKPIKADFDGDHVLDLTIWRPSLGTFFSRSSRDPNQVTIRQWGLPGDIPLNTGTAQ